MLLLNIKSEVKTLTAEPQYRGSQRPDRKAVGGATEETTRRADVRDQFACY